MIKLNTWVSILSTWIFLAADLLLSYMYLRDPNFRLEWISLGLNFVTTTLIYYIYMNIAQGEDGEEGASKSSEEKSVSLYKLNFGPLIEDMGVWLILFFLLYNIVPMTLFVHVWVTKNI
ncbi:MAG: hypothetical protein PHC34_05335 [Candidatus Gastranaerophilales bacterium]|nr:hypothetical protein [Candidatus Gastranaerophilales bacterium]